MFKKFLPIFVILLIVFFWHLDVFAVTKDTVCSCNVVVNYDKIQIDVKSGESIKWPKTFESEHFFKIEEGPYKKISFTGEPDGVDGVVDFPSGIEPKCDTCEKEFPLSLADSIKQGKQSSLMTGASATCEKFVCEVSDSGGFINCVKFVTGQVVFDNVFPTSDAPKEWLSTDKDQTVELKTKDKAAAEFECKEGCDVLDFSVANPANSATAVFHPNKISKFNETTFSLFTLKSEANKGVKCTDSAVTEGKYFFKVKYDCMMRMEPIPPAAALDCKKPENLPECQKQCENDYCEWKNACVNKAVASTPAATPPQVSTYDYNNAYFEGQYPVPENWTGAMPSCAFSGTCRDVNDLVALIIRWASGFFAILGTFAFAFFIYGGFTIMMSLGNAEKVKKGQQTLVAAVIGLFIAFSAYLAIDFMLDALNVSESFRGINLSN